MTDKDSDEVTPNEKEEEITADFLGKLYLENPKEFKRYLRRVGHAWFGNAEEKS